CGSSRGASASDANIGWSMVGEKRGRTPFLLRGAARPLFRRPLRASIRGLARRLRLASARAPRSASTLSETAAQALHEVDHFGLSRLLAGLELDLLAFELAVDDPHQVLSV